VHFIFVCYKSLPHIFHTLGFTHITYRSSAVVVTCRFDLIVLQVVLLVVATVSAVAALLVSSQLLSFL